MTARQPPHKVFTANLLALVGQLDIACRLGDEAKMRQHLKELLKCWRNRP